MPKVNNIQINSNGVVETFELSGSQEEKTYEKFVVVGIYGQSNAVGYDESILTFFDKPKYENRIFQIGHNSREFKPLTYCAENAQDMSTVSANGKGGFRSNDAWTDDGRINYAKTKGIALPLANLIVDAIPEDYGVIIVPSAYGGRTIDNLSKNGMGYYGRFIENIKTAVNRNPDNVLLGIVWCQGEFDASNSVSGANYKTKFVQLINDVKADLEEIKNKTIDKKSVDASKWYVFEYPLEYKNTNTGRAILQAQKEVVGESNYAYIPDDTPYNETTITSANIRAHYAGDAFRKVIAPRVFNVMANNGVFATNLFDNHATGEVDTSELETKIDKVKIKNSQLEMLVEALKTAIEDLGGVVDDPTKVVTNLVQGDLLTNCYYVNSAYTATVTDGNLTITNGGDANGKCAVMLDTSKYNHFEGIINGDNFAVFMAVKPEDIRTGHGVLLKPTSDNHNAYWINGQGRGNHGTESLNGYTPYPDSLDGKKLIVDINESVVTLKVENHVVLSYDLSLHGLIAENATKPAIGFSSGVTGGTVSITGCKVSYPAPIPTEEEEGFRTIQQSDITVGHKRNANDNIGNLTIENGTLTITGGGGVGAYLLPDDVTHFEGTFSQWNGGLGSFLVILAKGSDREEGLFIPKLNTYQKYVSTSNLIQNGTVNGTYATSYSGSKVGAKLTMDIIGTTVKVTLGGQTMYEHDISNGGLFDGAICTTPVLGFGCSWSDKGTDWQLTDCKIS